MEMLDYKMNETSRKEMGSVYADKLRFMYHFLKKIMRMKNDLKQKGKEFFLNGLKNHSSNFSPPLLNA